MAHHKHIFGRFCVPTHAKAEYRERVTDDHHAQKHTGRDIERIIRHALNEIENVETLPKLNVGYIAEVVFAVKNGYTQPYYIPLKHDINKNCEYVACSIWTRDIYESMRSGRD